MLGDKAVALVSDAGTPLDLRPRLQIGPRRAGRGRTRSTPFPGPCAAIAALTLAGLPTDRFLFVGFLPAKAKARSEAIAEIAGVRASLVLYESGPRLATALAALARGPWRPRDAAVVREISKLHEECVTGTLAELAAALRRCAAQGRNRDRRRTARRARGGKRRGAGRRARRGAGTAVPVARGRRGRGTARPPQEARLCPRARTVGRLNRRGCRRARPQGGNAGGLVAAAARLADPRAAGARARAAKSTSSPGAGGPWPSSRSRRATARTRRPWRSMNIACAASRSPPSGWRRATRRAGDDIRIDAMFIVPGRWPRHLANVWHG